MQPTSSQTQQPQVLFISTQLEPLPSKQQQQGQNGPQQQQLQVLNINADPMLSTLPRLMSPDSAALMSPAVQVSPGLQQDMSLSLRIRALLAHTAQSILSPSSLSPFSAAGAVSQLSSNQFTTSTTDNAQQQGPKGILKRSGTHDVQKTNSLQQHDGDQLLKGRAQTLPTHLPSQYHQQQPALRKQFRFNETVIVGEAHGKEEYERKSDFQLNLTPELAMEIKKELNYFKQFEMAVHDDARQHTHLFKL